MSIDVLQNKIRKMKNPSALTLAPISSQIPEGYGTAGGYFCALLQELKDIVPAVRVSFGAFALLGVDGIPQLQQVLHTARELGYYVILDWQHLESPEQAANAAKILLQGDAFPCDAVSLCGYAGSDCIKPYVAAAGKRAIFVTLKTVNKSSMEIQDLQTGGRVVYTAAADLLNRWGEPAMERCGYSRLGAICGAANASSIRTLRQKYPRMFLLVDGLDAPGANAKNVSYGFDKLGHGVLCSAGSSIVAAWKEAEDGTDPLAAAVEAAERMKRNLGRYVTIL